MKNITMAQLRALRMNGLTASSPSAAYSPAFTIYSVGTPVFEIGSVDDHVGIRITRFLGVARTQLHNPYYSTSKPSIEPGHRIMTARLTVNGVQGEAEYTWRQYDFGLHIARRVTESTLQISYACVSASPHNRDLIAAILQSS